MSYLNTYAARLIWWADFIKDRYYDDPFTTELRIEVATRLVEAQYMAFCRLAPQEARWRLQTGSIEGVSTETGRALLAASEDRVTMDLEEIERHAALAVQNRLQAAGTCFCKDTCSPCRSYMFANRSRQAYLRFHGSIRRGQASGRSTLCPAVGRSRRQHDHQQPAGNRATRS